MGVGDDQRVGGAIGPMHKRLPALGATNVGRREGRAPSC